LDGYSPSFADCLIYRLPFTVYLP
jgi:amino acid adenylation domain